MKFSITAVIATTHLSSIDKKPDVSPTPLLFTSLPSSPLSPLPLTLPTLTPSQTHTAPAPSTTASSPPSAPYPYDLSPAAVYRRDTEMVPLFQRSRSLRAWCHVLTSNACSGCCCTWLEGSVERIWCVVDRVLEVGVQVRMSGVMSS